MKRKWMTWLLAGTMSISAMAVPAGNVMLEADAWKVGEPWAYLDSVTLESDSIQVGESTALTLKWEDDVAAAEVEYYVETEEPIVELSDETVMGATVTGLHPGKAYITVYLDTDIPQSVLVHVLPNDLMKCTESYKILKDYMGVNCLKNQALIVTNVPRQKVNGSYQAGKVSWKYAGTAANAKYTTDYVNDEEGLLCYCLIEPTATGTIQVEQTVDTKTYYYNFNVAEDGIITLIDKEKPSETPSDITDDGLGDVNSDGKFSVADITAMHKWLVHKRDVLEDMKQADMNGDGKVNIFDLTLLKRKLVNMLPNYIHAKDLLSMYKASAVEVSDPDDAFINGQTAFAVEMLQNAVKQNEVVSTNTLISPYSAVQALAMTANGADGETLKQMEEVLCDGLAIEKLDGYLRYMNANQPNEENCKLLTANSIWQNTEYAEVQFNDKFLQMNKDYFNASVYQVPFSRPQTLKDMNTWVNKHTDGMIPMIVDENSFSNDTVMSLINAITFDAKWARPYEKYSNEIRYETFTSYDGAEQDVEMMHGSEGIYLNDGKATGFVKYYEGGRYAFMTLLPNEDVDIVDYVAQLTPETLTRTLTNTEQYHVVTSMPKFSVDYEVPMREMLEEMGMPDAFDGNTADFSNMSDKPLHIESVRQKTHIDVDEEGTRASAATIVDMAAGAVGPEYTRYVILDRPFVYGIVDMETKLPIFLGTEMTIQ